MAMQSAKAAAVTPLVLPETSSGQLKASLRTPALDARSLIGRAIHRAVQLAGMSHKEAAASIGVNDSQFGKWLSGNEPPQVHRVFAVEALQQPLIVALAECCASEGIAIKTVVTLERKFSDE